MDSPSSPKTEADLEFSRLREALAARTMSPAGAARAIDLPFLETRDDVMTSLAEVREAVELEERGEPLPRAQVAVLDEALSRVRIGSRLASDELRHIVKALVAARDLRRFLRSRAEVLPALARACDPDPALDALASELGRCFESDGSISDQASPRLAQLRSERRSSRDRILRRLDELIGRYKDLLQDGFWTERDGRYVLPVRADAHERFPGIVHGTSSGGMTLFVEPRVIVPMGNRHKVLDAMVAQAEDEVLARLSEQVAESVDAIAFALDALAHADLRGAEAKLSVDLELGFPEVLPVTMRDGVRDPSSVRASLRKARHPILLLDGVDVVPSDITLSAGRALVVSGPNAGGKTVALKALGLAALLVRAGMPIPAAQKSEIALFDEVLTDVGDDQSLSKNLSTFSAHVRNLAEILDKTRAGSLVLLDELASGTDPREGEALAQAVLESLAARGGAVACTTHYEGLKLLALRDERFANASVGFDIETMSPTFRLSLGVPGASSALAVARRFGIPSTVIERAQKSLSEEALTLGQMMDRLAADQRGVEKARRDVEEDREKVAVERAALDAERERLARREELALARETDELRTSVRSARERLRVAEKRLKTDKLDAREVAETEKEIDKVARTVSIGGPVDTHKAAKDERPSIPAGEVFVGMKVFVPRLRTDADVLEILPGGQLRVAAGPLKLLTSVADIKRASGQRSVGPQGGNKQKKPDGKKLDLRTTSTRTEGFDAADDPDVPIQTSDNAVDLRGLRADEAVSMAEQFLDRCIGAHRRVAFLIHGHGTGALKQVIRETLKASSYVSRFRAGGPGEGGDGVTIVWLR